MLFPETMSLSALSNSPVQLFCLMVKWDLAIHKIYLLCRFWNLYWLVYHQLSDKVSSKINHHHDIHVSSEWLDRSQNNRFGRHHTKSCNKIHIFLHNTSPPKFMIKFTQSPSHTEHIALLILLWHCTDISIDSTAFLTLDYKYATFSWWSINFWVHSMFFW